MSNIDIRSELCMIWLNASAKMLCNWLGEHVVKFFVLHFLDTFASNINPRKVGSLKRHQRLGGGILCRPLNIDLPDFFDFFFIPSLTHI